jgi:hypothetical protein
MGLLIQSRCQLSHTPFVIRVSKHNRTLTQYPIFPLSFPKHLACLNQEYDIDLYCLRLVTLFLQNIISRHSIGNVAHSNFLLLWSLLPFGLLCRAFSLRPLQQSFFSSPSWSTSVHLAPSSPFVYPRCRCC